MFFFGCSFLALGLLDSSYISHGTIAVKCSFRMVFSDFCEAVIGFEWFLNVFEMLIKLEEEGPSLHRNQMAPSPSSIAASRSMYMSRN